METIILFIVILAVLVFVHELGHFSLAKFFGIRVDEFAIGFPPRLFSKKLGETIYSVNLIPFGGYVKIFGEEAADVSADSPEKERSFSAKNRAKQALVLSGGILMNIFFAWILLSFAFMTGAPASTEQYSNSELKDVKLMIVDVTKGSPADSAGIKPGDVILNISDSGTVIINPTIDQVRELILLNAEMEIALNIQRNKENMSIKTSPKEGVVGDTVGIGISMDMIGTLKLPFFSALIEGAEKTYNLTIAIAVAIAQFLYQLFTFTADFAEVSGPVGIAVVVGNASELGFFYLLSLTAIISLNLAVVNFIPFPALDGGRLFFVLIESIIRRPLVPKITRMVNAVGFLLLLGLLVLVTFKDIVKLL